MVAVGRLAHLPELRFGQQVPFCEFRLLATRKTRREDVTEAVTFICFGEEAEEFCELAQKGERIWAEGWQETHRWTDSGGQARTTTKFSLHRWSNTGPLPPEGPPHGAPAGRDQPEAREVPKAEPPGGECQRTSDEPGFPSELI